MGMERKDAASQPLHVGGSAVQVAEFGLDLAKQSKSLVVLRMQQERLQMRERFCPSGRRGGQISAEEEEEEEEEEEKEEEEKMWVPKLVTEMNAR
jgi:hypothetical protein